MSEREEIERRLDELRDQFIAEYLRYLDALGVDDDVRSYIYVSEMPDGSPVNGHAVAFGAAMVPSAGEDEINKFGRVFRQAYGDFERAWEKHAFGLGRPTPKRR